MAGPSHIEIAGKKYPLTPEDGLRFVYRQAAGERRDVAGADREAENLDEGVIRWRQDNWSGGEGQEWFNPAKPRSSTRYFTSGGAVDPSIEGRMKLGLSLASEVDLGSAISTVPHLGIAEDVPFVVYDQSIQRRSGTTWSAVTPSVAFTANVRGPVSTTGQYAWVGTGSAGEIMRLTVDSGTSWTTVKHVTTNPGDMPVPLNKLIYYVKNGTSVVTLYSVDPTASSPATASSKGTAAPEDTAMAVAAMPPNLFVTLSRDDKTAPIKLYRWDPDGGVFIEWAEVPENFRLQNNLRQSMVGLNRTLFMGGYFYDYDTNTKDPALLWFTSEGSGSVGRLRRGATEEIQALYRGTDNRVIFGTSLGKVYAYDMARGGFWQMLEGATTTHQVSSIAYHNGVWLVATRVAGSGGKQANVYASLATGNNKYPASVKVEGSKWDFGFPGEEKLLRRITIATDSLAAGEKVALEFSLDDGAAVTTDSAGATMEHTSGTTTTFKISDEDTERTFRWLKVNYTMTAGTNRDTTPEVYFIDIEASVQRKHKYVIARVDLSNDHDSVGPKQSGAQMASTLRTLIENTSDRVFAAKLHYSQSQGAQQEAPESLSVEFSGDQAISFSRAGEGIAELVMRVVS